MSTNCLNTKLKASVSSSLPKLGEIRFKALAATSTIVFSFSNRLPQEAFAVVGSITSQTWASAQLTVVAPKGSVIVIPDKYKITIVRTENFIPIGEDISLFEWSAETLDTLNMANMGAYTTENEYLTGDVSCIIDKFTELKALNIYNQKVYGSIDGLNQNNGLLILNIENNKDVVGNIGSIVSTHVRQIIVLSTGIIGNLSDVVNSPALTHLRVSEGVSGNVSALSGLSALQTFDGQGEYNGDLSQLPASQTQFISRNGGSFTWTTRAIASNIFSIGRFTNFLGTGIDLGNYLDTYLADIVNCTVPSSAPKINVVGAESASTPTLAAALKTKIGSSGMLIVNGVLYN